MVLFRCCQVRSAASRSRCVPYQPSACNSDSSTNVMTESRDPSSCGQALSTLRLSQRTVNANNAMDGLGAAVNCSSSKSSPCLGHSCRGYCIFDVHRRGLEEGLLLSHLHAIIEVTFIFDISCSAQSENHFL